MLVAGSSTAPAWHCSCPSPWSCIAGIVGVGVAMIAGYRGGRLDAFLMRTTDASLAFPVILLAIVVVGVFGPSTTLVVIILAVAVLAELRPCAAQRGPAASRRRTT